MRALLIACLMWLLPWASVARAFPCAFDTYVDSFVDPKAGWPVTPMKVGSSMAFTGMTNDFGVYYALLQDCASNHHVLLNSSINPETTASKFATAVHGFFLGQDPVTLQAFLDFATAYGAEIRTGHPGFEPVGSCDCDLLWPNGVTE